MSDHDRPGICKCTTCGETIELPSDEQLPSCPSCGHEQWVLVGEREG